MRLSLPVILIVFVQISNAQGFNFGITAGGNISTVFKQSDYEINDANYNKSQYIPLPGFEFGIFTSHPLSEKIVVTNTLDFARLAYKSKDEVTLTSPLGEPIWTTDQIKYCSGYLRLRPILSYTFFD